MLYIKNLFFQLIYSVPTLSSPTRSPASCWASSAPSSSRAAPHSRPSSSQWSDHQVSHLLRPDSFLQNGGFYDRAMPTGLTSRKAINNIWVVNASMGYSLDLHNVGLCSTEGQFKFPEKADSDRKRWVDGLLIPDRTFNEKFIFYADPRKILNHVWKTDHLTTKTFSSS